MTGNQELGSELTRNAVEEKIKGIQKVFLKNYQKFIPREKSREWLEKPTIPFEIVPDENWDRVVSETANQEKKYFAEQLEKKAPLFAKKIVEMKYLGRKFPYDHWGGGTWLSTEDRWYLEHNLPGFLKLGETRKKARAFFSSTHGLIFKKSSLSAKEAPILIAHELAHAMQSDNWN